MHFPPKLLLGMILGVALGGVVVAADTAANIESVLQDMLVRGGQFPPERLLALGPEGFSAVLDRIFPETATVEEVEVADDVVTGLIAELGDENFQTREAATERLRALGPGARRAVMRAAQSADAEVSYRAVRVLRGWEQRRTEDMTRYVAAMAVVLPKVADAPRLEELARRVRAVLDLGVPYGGKQQILRESIASLYRAKDNRYLNPLRPLLDHANAKVAVFCVQQVGYAIINVNRVVSVDARTGRVLSTSRSASVVPDMPPPWVPQILLAALESSDADVLLAAVSAVPRRAPSDMLVELRPRLTKAFGRENETLKLRACVPLIALFDDDDAIDFMLIQATQKDNPTRRNEAVNLWPQFETPARPVPAKLLAGLTPLLKANEQPFSRQRAATILGGYAGGEVIAALVPLVADNYQPLAAEARRRLLQQPDKKAVRAALEAAAADKGNTSLQTAARQLLEQIDRPS